MKKHLYTMAVLLLGILGGAEAIAQSKVKDGTLPGSSSLPRAGALLELESSNKGLMMPRVSLTTTTTWGLSGTDSAGMMVYNNNPAVTGTAAAPALSGGVGIYFWDGDRWAGTGAGTKDVWQTKGNAGTTPPADIGISTGAGHYIGTSDAKNVAIGTNNITRAVFNQSGTLFGGTAAIGQDSVSGADGSFIWGEANGAYADYTGTFGFSNKVALTAERSIVGGSENYLSGSTSAVFGAGNRDSANYTLVAGLGNVVAASMTGAVVAGQYNEPVASSLLTVGNGDAAPARKNALVVMKNGSALVNAANSAAVSTPRAELDVTGTGAVIVPVGTTAQRPAIPVAGMIRLNASTGKFEGYNGITWLELN